MPTKQPRRSREQWQTLVTRFNNQSELTQQQFCQQESLSLGSFRKWLYTLAAEKRKAQEDSRAKLSSKNSKTTGSFGPITIHETDRSPCGCYLELPGNVLLHTRTLPTVDYLHSLVKVFGYGR